MTKFEKTCLAAYKTLGQEPFFCRNEDRKDDIFEDDGYLHVVKKGLRAVFDVSNHQNLSGAEQNEKTKKVLTLLGLEHQFKLANPTVTSRFLVDETDDDEDDYCPHCGRGGH